MNKVRFNYLYRDASNYLQRGAVVFADANDLSLQMWRFAFAGH